MRRRPKRCARPRCPRTEIDDRVSLISITWLPTNGGLVNPAADEADCPCTCHPYLLDGYQVVGQKEVEVEALGCDMFTATGRKFLRGPRGSGFLYMRRAMLERTEPALLDLFGAAVDRLGHYRMRADAHRIEIWETNYATRLRFGAAVDYILANGIGGIEARRATLGCRLRLQLQGYGVRQPSRRWRAAVRNRVFHCHWHQRWGCHAAFDGDEYQFFRLSVSEHAT